MRVILSYCLYLVRQLCYVMLCTPVSSIPSQSLLQHNALNIDDVVARLQHYRKTCPVYVLNRSTWNRGALSCAQKSSPRALGDRQDEEVFLEDDGGIKTISHLARNMITVMEMDGTKIDAVDLGVGRFLRLFLLGCRFPIPADPDHVSFPVATANEFCCVLFVRDWKLIEDWRELPVCINKLR